MVNGNRPGPANAGSFRRDAWRLNDPEVIKILPLASIYNLFHTRDLTPAILNATYDATGVRINKLPITSERIWQALQEKK